MQKSSNVVRYVTRQHLIEISKLGLKWDFNRQLKETVAELPERNYAVDRVMVHGHRHGKPCKTHMRLIINLNRRPSLTIPTQTIHASTSMPQLCFSKDRLLFADVPMDYFKTLPTLLPPVKKAKEKTATAKDIQRIFEDRGNVGTNNMVKMLAAERLSVSRRLIAAERKAMFGTKPTYEKVKGSLIRRSARGPVIVWHKDGDEAAMKMKL